MQQVPPACLPPPPPGFLRPERSDPHRSIPADRAAPSVSSPLGAACPMPATSSCRGRVTSCLGATHPGWTQRQGHAERAAGKGGPANAKRKSDTRKSETLPGGLGYLAESRALAGACGLPACLCLCLCLCGGVPMDLTPRNPGSLVLARPGRPFPSLWLLRFSRTRRPIMDGDRRRRRDSLLDSTPGLFLACVCAC